ncbi:cytosine deaminase, partial [Rhizobium ruizarguesonis]
GLDVDLHVDETDDRGAETLKAIAEAVLRTGFAGKVTAGHCCSLARPAAAPSSRPFSFFSPSFLSFLSLPLFPLSLP